MYSKLTFRRVWERGRGNRKVDADFEWGSQKVFKKSELALIQGSKFEVVLTFFINIVPGLTYCAVPGIIAECRIRGSNFSSWKNKILSFLKMENLFIKILDTPEIRQHRVAVRLHQNILQLYVQMHEQHPWMCTKLNSHKKFRLFEVLIDFLKGLSFFFSTKLISRNK